MDDEKVKSLFAGFNPELSDSDAFMARVTRGLDAVEIVRERYAEVQRRQRRALVAATLIGVLVGIGMTMLYMLVADHIAAIHLPDSTFIVRTFGLETEPYDLSVDLRIPMLVVCAVVATLTAVNTYTLSVSRGRSSDRGVSTLRESARAES